MLREGYEIFREKSVRRSGIPRTRKVMEGNEVSESGMRGMRSFENSGTGLVGISRRWRVIKGIGVSESSM